MLITAEINERVKGPNWPLVIEPGAQQQRAGILACRAKHQFAKSTPPTVTQEAKPTRCLGLSEAGVIARSHRKMQELRVQESLLRPI